MSYIVRKNVQGDITHLLDTDGKVVARYVYDAWGNHVILGADNQPIADHNHIGSLNPYRYRSYLYDRETGLYWLNTRFYDPSVGRFISADHVSYLDPKTVNGLNLYAYCGSNAVMNVDPNGTFLSNVFSGLSSVGSAVINHVVAPIGSAVINNVIVPAGSAVINNVIAPMGAAVFNNVVMPIGTALVNNVIVPAVDTALSFAAPMLITGFMGAMSLISIAVPNFDADGWSPYGRSRVQIWAARIGAIGFGVALAGVVVGLATGWTGVGAVVAAIMIAGGALVAAIGFGIAGIGFSLHT